jgi:hypothetical protein
VCTRQRTFGLFSVCTRTAKEPRVAHLCSWELTDCGCRKALPCGKGRGRTAKITTRHREAHDKDIGARKVLGARQSSGSRHRIRRMAELARTTKQRAHGIERDAWQRLCRAEFAKSSTKDPLLSVSLPTSCCRAATHGKVFAVQIGPFAVRLVARQRSVFPYIMLFALTCLKSQNVGGHQLSTFSCKSFTQRSSSKVDLLLSQPLKIQAHPLCVCSCSI